MSVILESNNYGKSAVRLVKVTRQGDVHTITDLTVGVRFEGEFERVHTEGDNSGVLPTDTMKNSVYALARRTTWEQPEQFGIVLATHFAIDNPNVTRIRIDVSEHRWERLVVRGRPHDHAFKRAGSERRTAVVTRKRSGDTIIEGGVEGLVVLKSAHSAFEGYRHDPYTTLEETSDRLMATEVTASWRYVAAEISYKLAWQSVRQVMLETFADHDSKSVQHTLYAMAEAALEQCPDISEIRLSLPNKHHLLVDLAPFGMQNANEIFVATEAPYGVIEATVRRGPA